MSDQRKQRRLEAAVQAVQLKWGAQALHKGTRLTPSPTTPSLPTGLPKLDRLLAIGGLPLGHISEWIGPPTSGKRTLALHVLAQAQQRLPCIYIDLARTFDPAYAAACHVDLASLVLATPDSPAQALDLVTDLAAGGHFGLIVFDSTNELAIEPLPASAAATALRRLRRALHNRLSVLLFLTTAAWSTTASPPPQGPAGFDLAQAAGLRLGVDRRRWLRRWGGSIRGYEAQVTVLRSRWSEPGQQTTVRITFNGVRIDETQHASQAGAP